MLAVISWQQVHVEAKCDSVAGRASAQHVGPSSTTFASADMAWGTLHCVLPGLTDQSLSQEPFPWAGAWPGVRFICYASFGYFGRGQPRSALLSKMIYQMEFKFSFSTFEQDVMPLVIQTPCVEHAIPPTFAYSLFKQTELWGLSGIRVAPSQGVLTGVLSCTPLAQQGVLRLPTHLPVGDLLTQSCPVSAGECEHECHPHLFWSCPRCSWPSRDSWTHFRRFLTVAREPSSDLDPFCS